MAKGNTVIALLNRIIDYVESDLANEVDVAAFAFDEGSTEYHVRRMFSSLAGMPLSEYIRRRRMTVAASRVIAGDPLLDVAVRFGYGSTEAFGRAFRAVHGATPAEVRERGGPLQSQSVIRFRLTVEGNSPMHARIVERLAFALIGHAARVPLIHVGVNPHIQAHIAAIAPEEHARLKALSTTEPAGLLQISADVDPDYTEGTELTYLHGVAVDDAATVPADLDAIAVAAGAWVVFTTSGPYPSALQDTWAASASEWFPSNPWRLREGPSIVAIVERADDFRTATTELWLPVERS